MVLNVVVVVVVHDCVVEQLKMAVVVVEFDDDEEDDDKDVTTVSFVVVLTSLLLLPVVSRLPQIFLFIQVLFTDAGWTREAVDRKDDVLLVLATVVRFAIK